VPGHRSPTMQFPVHAFSIVPCRHGFSARSRRLQRGCALAPDGCVAVVSRNESVRSIPLHRGQHRPSQHESGDFWEYLVRRVPDAYTGRCDHKI